MTDMAHLMYILSRLSKGHSWSIVEIYCRAYVENISQCWKAWICHSEMSAIMSRRLKPGFSPLPSPSPSPHVLRSQQCAEVQVGWSMEKICVPTYHMYQWITSMVRSWKRRTKLHQGMCSLNTYRVSSYPRPRYQLVAQPVTEKKKKKKKKTSVNHSLSRKHIQSLWILHSFLNYISQAPHTAQPSTATKRKLWSVFRRWVLWAAWEMYREPIHWRHHVVYLLELLNLSRWV